jgi:hypothetical protein
MRARILERLLAMVVTDQGLDEYCHSSLANHPHYCQLMDQSRQILAVLAKIHPAYRNRSANQTMDHYLA